MFDYYVKIYLYIIIFLNLFYILLYLLVWLIRRQPLLKPKAIWRDVLFLIIGLLAFWLFSSGTLGGGAVLLLTSALLLGSVYALEAIEKIWSRRDVDNRAT